MLCEAFRSVLQAGREDFNAQFRRVRRQHPTLEGEAFSAFLATCADPVVRAVEAAAPDRARDVAMAAYLVALELVAQRLAGPGAKETIIAEGWQRVLPAAAHLLVAAPRRVLVAVSNALHQLTAFPEARPAQWIAEMERLAPHAPDTEAFLKLGQLVAWRAGLAHFRTSALAAAAALPEPLALLAVGAPDGNWSELRARFEADPWFIPAENDGRTRFAKRVGQFRGFGGLFTQPPHVAHGGNDFFVCSGPDCWLLTVDACGATFHRAGREEFELARRQPIPRPAPQLRGSVLEWNGEQVPLPLTGEVTSVASSATTFAATESSSHSIVFVALACPA